MAGGITWQTLVMALALIATITAGAVQLGSVQTHVLINTDRLSLLESEHRNVDKFIAQLQASQSEVSRRLSMIETHDIETRANETKILERLSKIEAH